MKDNSSALENDYLSLAADTTYELFPIDLLNKLNLPLPHRSVAAIEK